MPTISSWKTDFEHLTIRRMRSVALLLAVFLLAGCESTDDTYIPGRIPKETAIAIAMRRFEQFKTLRAEADNLRQALDDRKVIERAKGILMKRAGLDEADAFRRLQKLASEESRKLVEVAQMILVAERAVQPPDK